jgi:hypothetical protein
MEIVREVTVIANRTERRTVRCTSGQVAGGNKAFRRDKAVLYLIRFTQLS